MISTLKHILIAVKDLDSACSQYQSLLGKPSKRITDLEFADCSVQQFNLNNCCINLCQSSTGSRWSKLVDQKLQKSGEGVFGFILTSENFSEYTQQCIANGIDISPISTKEPRSASKNTDLPQLVELVIDCLDGFSIFAQSLDISDSQNLKQAAISDAPTVENITSLDHLVINSSDVQALIPVFKAAGMDLRLDQTVETWGFRQLFYRAGGCIIEVIESIDVTARPQNNEVWGLAYQVQSLDEMLLRLASLDIVASDSRQGRKKGTVVSTLKSHNLNIATLLISHAEPRA